MQKMPTEGKPRFPSLKSLGLSAEQLDLLAENGSLCREERGEGRTYYRLRFREAGKQYTRYVGNEQGFVEQVRRELLLLQAKRNSRQEMRRLADKARQVARGTKRMLEPLLPTVGRTFHGVAIRRRRTNRSNRVVCLD